MTGNHAPIDANSTATATTSRRAPATPGARRRLLTRALVPIGLILLALWASSCDLPGTTVKAAVKDDVLKVLGTDGADVVALRLQAPDVDSVAVDVGNDGTTEFSFDRQSFTTIVVKGFDGDDVITADHVNGAFTVGETTLNGGEGADRLVFAGEQASEIFSVSAVGDHVRFTRDVASVALDLDGFETIDARAGSGADILDVSDLSGTDLTELHADFAATGGGDDAQIDEVALPPATTIGQDAMTATVDGLGAQVRIHNGADNDGFHVTGTADSDVVSVVGSPGDDFVSVADIGPDAVVSGAAAGMYVRSTAVELVHLDLIGGRDLFTARDTVVEVEVDGGDGNDLLEGGKGADLIKGGTGIDLLEGLGAADTLDGEAGADVLHWRSGGTNDRFIGGTGIDRMLSQGDVVDETYHVTSVRGHARITRSVDNSVQDLDEIETLDVLASNGVDVVNVHELADTDLTVVNTNLADANGADDGQVDEVVVPLSATVGQDGATGVVDGLGPQVRVLDAAPDDHIHQIGNGGSNAVQVTGTAGADTTSAFSSGTDVTVHGLTGTGYLRLTAIEELDVDLVAGDDSFATAGNLAALIAFDVDGGPGADSLRGSNGADTLRGGADDDFIDGNQGIDTVFGDDGADVFQWDPGDTNETLVGGAGLDRLAFNGSNAGEIFGVSAVGGHVRLTRNVAAVVMDLDEIETLDIHALGGTDVVNVANLTGTDLTGLNTHFPAFGGADDALIDELVVPLTAIVGQDGATGTVSGLGAQVRVLGASASDRIHLTGTAGADVVSVNGTPGADAASVVADGTDVAVSGLTGTGYLRLTAIETLDVNLADGDDSFLSTGNLAPLIALDVDGGNGADNLRGGNGADRINGGPNADFIDGNQGSDTVNGASGADVFQWDPGDGNETIVGGTGADRLDFNGSNIAEIYGVSAVGDHVRLTRNVAAIDMDLDQVETIDVHAFGGADRVDLADLTGTDLTVLNTDLAAIGGTDDAQVDEVVVGPGLTIGQNGSTATIDGLGAQVRVVGGAVTDRLQVVGTAASDVVHVLGTPGVDLVGVSPNGADVGVSGATAAPALRLTAVETLDVDLAGGDDVFSGFGSLGAAIALDVEGGNGFDQIEGSIGADVLSGGPDGDHLEGGPGVDTLTGGPGDDELDWVPGEGNDVVVGGTGSDLLTLFGNGSNEEFGLTASAGHVMVSRNFDAALDVDDVEQVEVRAGSGLDNITVNDLTGTDVVEIITDLSIGFLDDLQPDQVIVNGTTGNDTVSVTADGAAAVVQGLAATVRITGAGPTQDMLTVMGREGNDTINATPEAHALLLLALFP